MTKQPVMVLCALVAGCATVAATHAARIPPLPPASSFSARVDNVWFPLRPGSRYIYTGVKDAKPASSVIGLTRASLTAAATERTRPPALGDSCSTPVLCVGRACASGAVAVVTCPTGTDI